MKNLFQFRHFKHQNNEAIKFHLQTALNVFFFYFFDCISDVNFLTVGFTHYIFWLRKVFPNDFGSIFQEFHWKISVIFRPIKSTLYFRCKYDERLCQGKICSAIKVSELEYPIFDDRTFESNYNWRKKIINRLGSCYVFTWLFVCANHAVGFPTSCLAVCKYTYIVAVECVHQHGLANALVHVLLARLVCLVVETIVACEYVCVVGPIDEIDFPVVDQIDVIALVFLFVVQGPYSNADGDVAFFRAGVVDP
jgi:hypothetical protein